MKNFFKTIKDSVWGPEFYKTVGKKGKKEGLKYIAWLSLIFSVIVVIFMSVFLVPAMVEGFKYGSKFVIEKYPNDLVLTFKNGEVSTSVPRVYTFKATQVENCLGEGCAIVKKETKNFENFLVIDTNKRFENLSQFQSAKTATLMTKDFLIVSKEGGGFELNPIPKSLDFVLTKTKVEDLSARILPMIKYIAMFIVVFSFVILFFCRYIITIILALISALFMWIIGKIFKRGREYSEFFVTALYASTIIVALDILVLIFGGKMSFSSSVLLVLIVWFVNTKFWKKPELPAVEKLEAPMVESDSNNDSVNEEKTI